MGLLYHGVWNSMNGGNFMSIWAPLRSSGKCWVINLNYTRFSFHVFNKLAARSRLTRPPFPTCLWHRVKWDSGQPSKVPSPLVALSLALKWNREERRVILPSQCAVAFDLLNKRKCSVLRFLHRNFSVRITTGLYRLNCCLLFLRFFRRNVLVLVLRNPYILKTNARAYLIQDWLLR
jgi:hypothetical protein